MAKVNLDCGRCLRSCDSKVRRRRCQAIRSAGGDQSDGVTIVIGIDPGKSGGVSFFHNDWIHVEKMPAEPKDLADLLSTYTENETPVAYIEQIYLPAGKAGALTFGAAWGGNLAVLNMLGIKTELVRPQVWMKYLDCMTKGDKNVTKNRASELFGRVSYEDGKTVPITHWSSDALLIGYYGFLLEIEKCD